ncbi:MAG: asparagine synthase (glutamine-hydrolyzing) [Nitrospirae bacterium]|nr:asparagine synthase (glutamine-hydrolyzing) [Nitrospirota bacterium]
MDRTRLRRMTDSLSHRGPDAEGFHFDDRLGIGLGHRRLSIIDLTEQANQPMCDAAGELWIVFNGEIYNYVELREELGAKGQVFRTQSDTEVILAAYREHGMDFLGRLRGMFAMALFDTRRPRLILARDRIGKKPLYFARSGDAFLFASEPKAILASGLIGRSPDFEGLAQYLTLGFAAPPRTGFREIRKLPPAGVMTIEANGESGVHTYWSLNFHEKEPHTTDEWEEIVRHEIREAVRLRLRSDVPLGVFLSGGIDSSAVAALAADQTNRLRTFTVGFRETEWDERRYARIVAERLGTDHHELVVEPKPLEILPAVLNHYEDPIADASVIPTLYVAKIARPEVTVVLNGDGGDEIFGGYRGYQVFHAAQWLRRVPGSALLGHLAPLVPDAPRGSLPSRVKRVLELAGDAHRMTLERYSAGTMQPEDAAALLGPAWPDSTLQPAWEILEAAADASRPLRGVDRLLHQNLTVGLPGGLMVKMDRASMAHSLEARSPLLDHVLVERLARMPHNLKLHGLTTKYVLKRALRGLVPDVILRRSKMGFGVPLGAWFRGELRPLLERRLGEGRLIAGGVLARAPVCGLIREHVEGRADHWPKLWTLLFLELWWRTWVEQERIETLMDQAPAPHRGIEATNPSGNP